MLSQLIFHLLHIFIELVVIINFSKQIIIFAKQHNFDLLKVFTANYL